MDCGLIGLSGAGSTTLFQALTAHSVAVQPGTLRPRIGIAQIPDPRLYSIAEHIETRTIVPAALQLVDIPGIAPGHSEQAGAVLSSIRTVDAVCQVSRCFNIPGLPPADPVRDISGLETDLVLADLVVAEGSLDKARRGARSGDPDTTARAELLERIVTMLENEQPLRDVQWTDREQQVIRGYGLITAKPVLHIANVSEDDPGGDGPEASALATWADSSGGRSIAVCATLESEIAELDSGDRDDMLLSLGIDQPAVAAVAGALNRLMGLETFYTAGASEVRAWIIPHGVLAPAAAGIIHSDMERGFIRAECYHVDDLLELGSEKAIKDAGRLRSEGKNYAIREGDVVHFLFNV